MCMCSILVVAHFTENIQWLSQMNMKVVVIDKKAGNIGRESLSYLHWITENYNTLDEDKCTCFSQGRVSGFQMRHVNYTEYNTVKLDIRKDVDRISEKQLKIKHPLCKQNYYSSRNDMTCFPSLLHMFGISIKKYYTTFLSGYMIVRNKAIKRIPLYMYRKLIYGFINQELICPYTSSKNELGYVLERLWKHIWSCKYCNYTTHKPSKNFC